MHGIIHLCVLCVTCLFDAWSTGLLPAVRPGPGPAAGHGAAAARDQAAVHPQGQLGDYWL